ncbi:hypothetical protein BTR23_03550 [Alkalihalophilus pseudofirmus]|nr:hypothetical protein BTR23_03550 [Alkalihalophilus pseudofirmus]
MASSTEAQSSSSENDENATNTEEGKKDTREERNKNRKKRKKERIRIVPIWLRLFIVILLCGVSLVAGLMVGFGVIGNGTPTEILQRETWEHIMNIISGTE